MPIADCRLPLAIVIGDCRLPIAIGDCHWRMKQVRFDLVRKRAATNHPSETSIRHSRVLYPA
ncbi:MAG: hypothetical protein ACJ731_13860, partial [Vicinamibacterales bacterium]